MWIVSSGPSFGNTDLARFPINGHASTASALTNSMGRSSAFPESSTTLFDDRQSANRLWNCV